MRTFRGNGFLAVGFEYKYGKFNVIRGSKFSVITQRKLGQLDRICRERLIESGALTLDSNKEYYTLTRDIICDNPSQAASIVAGTSEDGTDAWGLDEDGKGVQSFERDDELLPQSGPPDYDSSANTVAIGASDSSDSEFKFRHGLSMLDLGESDEDNLDDDHQNIGPRDNWESPGDEPNVDSPMQKLPAAKAFLSFDDDELMGQFTRQGEAEKRRAAIDKLTGSTTGEPAATLSEARQPSMEMPTTKSLLESIQAVYESREDIAISQGWAELILTVHHNNSIIRVRISLDSQAALLRIRGYLPVVHNALARILRQVHQHDLVGALSIGHDDDREYLIVAHRIQYLRFSIAEIVGQIDDTVRHCIAVGNCIEDCE